MSLFEKTQQERGPRKLQAGHPHFYPWEGDEAPKSGLELGAISMDL